MAFWSTQRVRAEQQQLGNLIDPFDPEKVQQGAYELALSREVITTQSGKGPRSDGLGQTLEIPPGQFALLYTQETVTIPSNIIAFISIKTTFKSDGLVNISGFHVDPGFSGRLKFSVYNAGNLPIFLEYERETFLIWFSDLDAPTIEPYDKNHRHQNQNRITTQDRQRMSEPSHSPAALDERLHKVERNFGLLLVACGAVITTVFLPILRDWLAKPHGMTAPVTQPAAANPTATQSAASPSLTQPEHARPMMTTPTASARSSVTASPTVSPTLTASPKALATTSPVNRPSP